MDKRACTSETRGKRSCSESEIDSGIEGKWASFAFPTENQGKGFLIYWIISPRRFEGYPLRSPKHKYEPNIESRTYNFYHSCQQEKIRKHILEGKVADNFVIWNRRSGVDRILGCYENISHVTEIPDSKYGKRCAFMAKNAYVLKEDEGIPLSEFGLRVEKLYRHLSRWIRVLDIETTDQIRRLVKERVDKGKGMSAEKYSSLIARAGSHK